MKTDRRRHCHAARRRLSRACALRSRAPHALPGLPTLPSPPSLPPSCQVAGDQDLADFLSALDEGSTAAPGGVYASALPPAAAPASQGEPQAAEAAADAAEPTETAAGDAQPPAAAGAAGAGGSKVEAVCAAFRGAMKRRDEVRCGGGVASHSSRGGGGGLRSLLAPVGSTLISLATHTVHPPTYPPACQAAYLRAILTSHAKCGQLEAALAAVKTRKEAELQARLMGEVRGGGAGAAFWFVHFGGKCRSDAARQAGGQARAHSCAARHSTLQGGAAVGGPSAEDGLRRLLLFTPDDTL